jgi:plastocyanin
MNPRLAASIAAVALGGAVAFAGCSSNNKTTNPLPVPTAPESFASGDLTGSPFVHVFNTGGQYAYRCTHHAPDTLSGMVGHVNVDPTSLVASAAVTVGGVSNVFSPATVTIKPGGSVSWSLSSGTHNVTRP